MSYELPASAALTAEADRLLANGNGHISNGSEPKPISTEEFYEHPRVDVRMRTDNDSVILVTSLDGWLVHDSFGNVLIAHGVVKDSDNCPDLIGEEVTFAVDAGYALSVIQEAF